ncbi:MAG: hypothetical protein BWK80_36290 [Desulfobacteraceae bacterium IS3]|nr:MAG: hypothetical protein BWK80_36290 [Desulfobacteraceae bacterium IS3]
MFNFLKNIFRLPGLPDFPLKSSSVKFSLNRLTRGVDNIRYDVYLSPDFCKSANNLVVQAVAVHTRTEDILNLDKNSTLLKEKEEFRKLCTEVITDAVNKAKLRGEIQIDYMVQTAVAKLLLEEIRGRYEKLIVHFKNIIREYETSGNHEGAIQLKKELSEIQENRKTILHNVGREIFQYLIEIQNKDLREMREANFGFGAVLPDHVFSNPMLHAEDINDDFFMLESYDILLGHRVEDPDKYETLVSLIRELLFYIDRKDQENIPETKDPGLEAELKEADEEKINAWMSEADNVEILFNYFRTKQRRKLLKKQKADKKELSELDKTAGNQKKLLNFFYRKFKKKGLIKRITAIYEMQPVYLEYCPPLVPQVVLQFLLVPKSRKSIASRLKKLRTYYGRTFSLKPLQKLIINIEKAGAGTRKICLMRFLSGLIRYHRDFMNFNMLKEAMDSVNLATKEKIIELSRANNTLYEFLLPHERESEEKPVISHVIIKADVRGSTDIVHKMKERRLNPATHFSMNFFDPITEIIPEYGAVKVCIEGDAYILAIYERENSPEGWYSVARACGLAINMLSIIRRYNLRSKKYQLPALELGIGITYRDVAPTIFFDGDHQIMISSAINLADRLSGCSKDIRKKVSENKEPFNLYVFQGASDADVASTADDLSLRYNVNGIELDAAAFEKLSGEIDLKAVEVLIHKKKRKFYTGKFPTVTGLYQRLIIREDRIPKIDTDTFEINELTDKAYYEVCTNPKLYEYIR